MKTRWKILIAVGVFMLLACGVFIVTMRVQPENKVDAFKKILAEKGEKLEITEVLPAPVAAASNSAPAVEDAFRAFGSGNAIVPNLMQMTGPGKAMAGWARPDVRGYDFTNSWEDFATEIAADRPGIELLHQVLERPEVDFQPDYRKGFAMLLRHLAPFKQCVQRLSSAIIIELHEGDTGSATTNLCVLLDLVHGNRHEGILISQLVRVAMASIGAGATWEYLQCTNVTDAQLAAVQKAWEQQEFTAAAENTFVMERAMVSDAFRKMRGSHAEFRNVLDISSGGSSSSSLSGWPSDFDELVKDARLTGGEVMWRASWSYSEELHMLQADQVMLDAARAMKTNQFSKVEYDRMQTHLSSLGLTNAGEAFFRALKIPDFRDEFDGRSLPATLLKTIRVETARKVVITAIALKRFQLKQGQPAERLEQLVPEFIAAVPIDPYDGKPLKYRVDADGLYLLYSVGEDGVDDGGDASLGLSTSHNFYWQNNRARDWVWPQPATAAEIKAFQELPPPPK